MAVLNRLPSVFVCPCTTLTQQLHFCLQTMYKAAQMELAVLNRLGQSDPENRKHCIRLLRYFEYRHHMCLVSEHVCLIVRVCWLTFSSCVW